MQINQANMNEQEYFFENDIPVASDNAPDRPVHRSDRANNRANNKNHKAKSKEEKKCPICLEKNRT